MSHHYGPTVQPRAGTFASLRGDAALWVRQGEGVNAFAANRFADVMPIPEMYIPTTRRRLACPERPCIGKGSPSAASCSGLPARKGAGNAKNPPEDQVRKGRPKRVLSSLIPRVSGRRLDVMDAHTREQPADRSNAATCPDSGHLPTLEHMAGRHASPAVAFSPSCRRPGNRVHFDGARLVQAIVAASSGRPPSCAKEATAGKCARGVG